MKYDRYDKMRQMFLQKRSISNQELCDAFHISIETIRRDLNLLEQEGFIKRVYGGAVLSDDNLMPASMPPWSDRTGHHAEEKDALAAAALPLIPDGATIAVDSGTTLLAVAKRLHLKKDLTILTNSLYTALELSTSSNHMVYCIGGAIKKDEMITTGFLSVDFLNQFSRLDIAILSADGFTVGEGLTDYVVEMGILKRNLIEKADKVIVLVDHSKFSINAFYRVCGPEKIHTVLTGENAPQSAVEALRQAGVEVVTVGV